MGGADGEDVIYKTASRLKVVPWGIGGPQADLRVSIEIKDPAWRHIEEQVVLSRVNGLGLDLLELSTIERTRFGLVLIGGITEGSNSANPVSGSFQEGDSLKTIEGVVREKNKYENIQQLDGLDFDSTIKILGMYADYEYVRITIKRVVERKIVTVKVLGPDGAPYAKLKVLSGLGANMRTLLQASNINMYAADTYRFDSPYQQGNCGGDGTCGTCMIAITSGADKLNPRNRVEDKALKKSAYPPNFRWACRTLVAEDAEAEGECEIRLRPQTLL